VSGAPARSRGHEGAPLRGLPVLRWPAALALVLAGAAWLQAGVARAPFFADDFLFLDQVRLRSLWTALAGRDPIGNFVRPVGRQLWFWLLSHVGHESPLVFHLAGLALFLGALALLFTIARRLAGPVAATIATAFVALHYAADVPLLWAAGSQDLLALTGALAALALFLGGRRAWAAVALLLALLSKETVLLTPLVAALAARRAGEPWRASARRAWPLALAVGAWAALWLALAAHSAGARQAVGGSLGGLAAAFVHLVQVAIGAEWRSAGGARAVLPPLVPLALVAFALLAVAGVGGSRGARRAGEKRERGAGAAESDAGDAPAQVGSAAARADIVAMTPGAWKPALPAWAIGLAWALVGALPVAAVAPVWSAYYYLFALCGVGLALGDRLARASRPLALAVLVLLAWGSQSARRLDEFITAPGVWTRQSHVNRRYIERADEISQRYLRQLRRARPTLAPGSTVYFGGLAAFSGFQAGDGPLLRWAYHDTSLRSHFLLDFDPLAMKRGPTLAFVVPHGEDSLVEFPLAGARLHSFALTATASLRPRLALDILELPAAQDTGAFLPYWRGWLRLALGDSAGAYRDLRAASMTLRGPPTPEVAEAMERLAAGDSARAAQLALQAVRTHALDPEAHGLLGGLLVNVEQMRMSAAVEAFAAVQLAPDAPRGWWLLGFVQMRAARYREARASIERYLALGGGPSGEVEEARRALAWIVAGGPGGSRAQEALHEQP
jgi:hypothetical protein